MESDNGKNFRRALEFSKERPGEDHAHNEVGWRAARQRCYKCWLGEHLEGAEWSLLFGETFEQAVESLILAAEAGAE